MMKINSVLSLLAGGAAFALIGASPAVSSPITASVEFISYNGGGTGAPLTLASESVFNTLKANVGTSTVFSDYTFTFTGDLNWLTALDTNTVGQFIGASGTVSGVTEIKGPAGVALTNLLATQMSVSGDAKTGFFRLAGTVSSPGPYTGTITHDDGVTYTVGGNPLITSPGETSSDTDPFSTAAGFSNAPFVIDYVEGNGAPSILNLTVTSPVPEASTWGMMILGFMGVGFMAYRRKDRVAFRIA